MSLTTSSIKGTAGSQLTGEPLPGYRLVKMIDTFGAVPPVIGRPPDTSHWLDNALAQHYVEVAKCAVYLSIPGLVERGWPIERSDASAGDGGDDGGSVGDDAVDPTHGASGDASVNASSAGDGGDDQIQGEQSPEEKAGGDARIPKTGAPQDRAIHGGKRK